VNWNEGFNRFDFDNYTPVDKQIHAVTAIGLRVLIDKGNGLPPFEP
jgi:hypothetical protein